MDKDESEKKGPQKKGHKNTPQLWSEKSPSEIKTHEELLHEDRDPIYPIDPIEGQSPKKKKPG